MSRYLLSPRSQTTKGRVRVAVDDATAPLPVNLRDPLDPWDGGQNSERPAFVHRRGGREHWEGESLFVFFLLKKKLDKHFFLLYGS